MANSYLKYCEMLMLNTIISIIKVKWKMFIIKDIDATMLYHTVNKIK